MDKKTVNIPNISCDHCARTISAELEDLDGVQSVSVDVGAKSATIQFDSPASWSQIEDTLKEIGFAPES